LLQHFGATSEQRQLVRLAEQTEKNAEPLAEEAALKNLQAVQKELPQMETETATVEPATVEPVQR
jgi:hypothetical protein